jgi:hypothetical protein
MNNNILAIVFLMAGTLLTTAVTVVPAAYAGGDDDNGNKNKAEDESAAAIADCDDNDVEQAGYDCIAAAVNDIGVELDGDGGEVDTAVICHNPANGPPQTLEIPESAIDTHIDPQGIPPGHENDHLDECGPGET